MIAALGSRLALYLIGGALIVAVAAFGWAKWNGMKADLAEARAGLERATQAAEANAEAARMLSAQIAANDRAIQQAQAAASRARADLDVIRREIRDAPDTDDAPPAPVLRHALERLRGIGAGGDAN